MMKRFLPLVALMASPAMAAQKYPLVLNGLGQFQQIQVGDELIINSSTIATAPLNIPQGVAPTSPQNGDIWTTSTGLFARINGATIGPIGGGTVTSVGLSLPSIFTVSGSPVTTTGTLTGTLNSQSANTFLAAPNGSAGVPSFRLPVIADISGLGTGVGAALAQPVSGSGSIALTTSPTFVTPALGTPSSATLTNATGLPIVAGTTGTLTVARGGTNCTTAGVTCVQNIVGSQTANTVLAAPNGSAGVPTFRAISPLDVAASTAIKAATNAALTAMPSTYNVVERVGYYAAGDVSPLLYTASAFACTLNSGAGDGGSQVPTSDSKCWIASFPGSGADIKQFGARGDNSNDDTSAIQAALNTGLNITVPLGTFRTTAALSVTQGQRITGMGNTPYITAPGTIGTGSWFHINHAGRGFVVTSSGNTAISGIEFVRLGTIRDQPAPGAGWAPNSNDYDIYINNADVKIYDCMLLNPTLGIYLINGQYGRLEIDGLRGQAFQSLIHIAESYDVVRINNVNDWPFWHDDTNIHAYENQNLDTIYMERSDNPQLSNIFSYGARSMFRFGQSAAGLTSKFKLVNGDADLAKYGIYFDATINGATQGVTADFVNFSHQANSTLTDSIAIYNLANLTRANFVNFNTTADAQNGVFVSGAGNVLNFSGQTRITGYNSVNSTYTAFQVGSNNNVFIYDLPTIFVASGITQTAKYAGSGNIYVDDWRAYTPTITSGTGTFTSVSANARFKLWNNSVSVIGNIIITTNGTAASDVRATLPFASSSGGVAAPVYGRAIAVSGKALQGIINTSSTQMIVQNYDNSYPGANGETLVVEATYPIDAVN